MMADILVRNLDDGVKQRLKERAHVNGRSMEAEVRAILEDAVPEENIVMALRRAALEVGGFDDVPIPPRNDYPRSLVFD